MKVLDELFARYQAVLASRDAQGVADCYAKRFLHVTRRDKLFSNVWRNNDADFRHMLVRAGQWYADLGARRFELGAMSIDQLPQSHLLVRVPWRVLDAEGEQLVAYEVTFMVRVRGDHAEIVGLVPHNERRHLLDRGFACREADLYFDLPLRGFDQRSGVRLAALSRETG
jgi:hypothetical protein